jgi:glycosyltransferase involved in cell wall biosynthesis
MIRASLLSLRAKLLNPEIGIAHEFRPPPFGGSNQFLTALRNELRRRGFRVEANAIGPRTRACVLNAFAFDVETVRRTRHEGCRIVHRVDGPVDVYRGRGEGVDRLVAELNRELADTTVFQSRYSLEAQSEQGLEFRAPLIIPNAVDPAIFHAPQDWEPPAGRKLRLVSSSWSDNPNKGAPAVAELERILDWSRYDYTFVGRAAVPFERVRLIPPLPSRELADVLRAADVFIAPSLHDPSSNAVLEALACGLPVVYARSGGHPELVGEAGFGFDAIEEVPLLLDRLVEELPERRRLITVPSLADVTDRYLDAMGLDGAPFEAR